MKELLFLLVLFVSNVIQAITGFAGMQIMLKRNASSATAELLFHF